MCHGHVDLRIIEREVRERLHAPRPMAMDTQDAAVTVPPHLIGGVPGLVARLRALFRRLSAA